MGTIKYHYTLNGERKIMEIELPSNQDMDEDEIMRNMINEINKREPEMVKAIAVKKKELKFKFKTKK